MWRANFVYFAAKLVQANSSNDESHERWQTPVDDREYFCLRSQYFLPRIFAVKYEGDKRGGGWRNIYIGRSLIKATASSSPGYPAGEANGESFAIFGGENFPRKSLTSPGSSTSSTRRTEHIHRTQGYASVCVWGVYVCMCVYMCVCVCTRIHNVGGLCLVYRGGSSRRERRATASHWPPIGRSGGGSLQSSIQAVIG